MPGVGHRRHAFYVVTKEGGEQQSPVRIEERHSTQTGRKIAVINMAGKKVFPEEIEAVLNRHPAVRESRVYGAAHPHLGEVIEAEVALRSAVEPRELRDFCRAHVGPDKIPNRIPVVQSVARTAVTGKVRRPASLPVP